MNTRHSSAQWHAAGAADQPQRMAEILAQMSPEAAERLTVEQASRSGADRTLNPSTLPKIEGRPAGG